MERFLVIGMFVGVGWLLRRLPVFPRQTAQVLNLFALYAALPAVILLKAPQIQFSQEMLLPAVMPWAMLIFSAALVLWAGRVFSWSREVVGVLLLVVPMGNTSFMGVPMVLAFFGEMGIPALIVYDQIGTALIFAVYGSVVLAVYGSDVRIRPAEIARRAILFPPTLALIFGLCFRSWSYPEPLPGFLKTLSSMLTPLTMTAIGFQLTVRLSPATLRPLGFGLAVKLVAAPLAALAACRLLGFDALSANVSIFQAGMPPMVVAGTMAMAAGLAPELAAATVSSGMILSFLSLPLLFWLI
ncbi:Membrane transport protein [Pseudodesulfovibrio hydrargyri]|uniref:Membrane transport protein n=1 Tax=Pseudodesulfovibrio hydrargyri TaxID=2125990 RepID=A0A1J5N6X8_9BACT|nr:AEC family transporter [Pseudodesulfovibrio hydrargyri]OIQ50560.1 Membrane transport protein [Pseudodesulfovibrio hydrargyri]